MLKNQPNGLIPLSTNAQGVQCVSARTLYEFFKVKERFSRFYERMFEYGFTENIDYTPYQNVHPSNNQIIEDYFLTLDTAKEIAMLQRSEKGKQARQYFIECEKTLKSQMTPALPTTIKEVAMLLLQSEEEKERILKAKEEAEQQLGQTQEVVKLQEDVIKTQAPKVEYHDKVLQSKTLYATTLIAKELGMGAISLNKQLHDLGIIHKVGEAWVLTYKYQNKGYTGTKTYIYKDSNGEEKTSMLTVWTEKGREFIHQVLAKYNNKTA